MTVLEKIRRCVSLVWDFQEFYDEEDIEDFCSNEFPQHREIIEYFKHIETLEKENAELKKACDETQELLDKQIEATFKLDKENAELKEELNYAKTHCLFHSDCPTQKENAELKEDSAEWEKASDKWKSVYELTNNQLTKAKELLNMFLRLHYNPIVDEHTLFCKVEQFLKECK